MLFAELYHAYYERHALTRTRSPENVYYWWQAHGATFAGQNVEDLTRPQLQNWVDTLGTTSKSAATRAINQLAAIIGWGIKRGYVTCLNPCIGVERFTLRSRDRFLSPAELNRFKQALDRSPASLRDFVWLCLLTGARRGNVQAMRWDELDLDLAMWTFDQKNGDRQTVPLTTPALAILARRKDDASPTSPWVFPSARGGHLREPKRAWKKLLTQAGISNLRIHDLRRTLGSYLAIGGASPYIIGKALGHRDHRSTAIYARLNLDPVRQAMEETVNVILLKFA